MKSLLAVATVVALVTTTGTATAQDAQWRIAPYAWIAGLDGRIAVGNGGGGGGGLGDRLDALFGQLSSNMGLGGAMLYADWRGGRWSAFGDWTYVKVDSDASFSRDVLYDGVEAEVKGNVIQAAVGHAVYGGARSYVDAFAGVRFYHLDGTVKLRGGRLLDDRTVSQSKAWADGVIGLRWHAMLGEHWEFGAYGDVGTGGSDFTWQVLGSVGYRFSWGSIIGGWRHLDVDYDKDKLRIDAAITGPFVGVAFRF